MTNPFIIYLIGAIVLVVMVLIVLPTMIDRAKNKKDD